MVVTNSPPLIVVENLHTSLSGGRAALQANGVDIGWDIGTYSPGIGIVRAESRDNAPVRLLALEDAILSPCAVHIRQPDLKNIASISVTSTIAIDEKKSSAR